jgi:uncharacterized BrkB/YihY/UPF0761 family membrane protein
MISYASVYAGIAYVIFVFARKNFFCHIMDDINKLYAVKESEKIKKKLKKLYSVIVK